jgi:hypothetical protein
LFLKNQKSKSFRFKSTFYLDNIRRSTKDQKIYVKALDNSREQFIRVELTLRRPLIHRLKLDFPPAVEDFPIFRCFEFRRFEEDRLRNYLIRRNRNLIAQMEQRRPGYGSLVESTINSWVNCNFQTGHGDLKPLMEISEALKSSKGYLPNYSRFLKSVEDLNRGFSDMMASQRFLSSGRRRFFL